MIKRIEAKIFIAFCLIVLGCTAYCTAQNPAAAADMAMVNNDLDKKEKPKPHMQAVPIGQTFAKQINELMALQQQTNAKLSEITTVMREQAGLDTNYVFKGFTSKGQALYVGPPKETKEVP